MRPLLPSPRLPISLSPSLGPARITAATTPPTKPQKFWTITASAEEATISLRGYVGEPSEYIDWNGEERDTGGMGTLKEFEDELKALGDVPLITLYLTTEGVTVAMSSIIARQTARVVCIIDGYAFSAAPVIACAADEVRAASNALIMIHDAEFWCAGCDIASMQSAIKTLEACNNSMAAAFVNKAGGTPEEWMQRMTATTWMTGREAAALGLVDVVLDEVALSAYQPFKQVTARYQPPAAIRALFDTSPVSTPPSTSPPPSPMKPTPALITAAAAFGITLTADSTEADVTAALTKISAAAPKQEQPVDIDSKITAAVKPLQDELTRLKGLSEQGLTPGNGITAAGGPVIGSTKTGGDGPQTMTRSDFGKLTAHARAEFLRAKNQLID